MRALLVKLHLLVLLCSSIGVSSVDRGVLFMYIKRHGLSDEYNGILIDSSGIYRSFSFGGHSDVGYMIDTDTLPEGMDSRILELSTPAGRQLDARMVDEMQLIIDTVGETDLTFYGGPEDMGTYRISAFIVDSVNNRVREIICYQAGTTPACNSSPAAREIASIIYSLFDLGFSQDIFEHPPDSCRGLSEVLSPHSQPVRLSRFRHSRPRFDLKGKKVEHPATQVIVGEGARRLHLLK